MTCDEMESVLTYSNIEYVLMLTFKLNILYSCYAQFIFINEVFDIYYIKEKSNRLSAFMISRKN